MIVTKLLESVRRVGVRTNRLVNDTMGGAYLSGFKERGMYFAHFVSHEIGRSGNCGEFAIIKSQADGSAYFLIPSNSTGLAQALARFNVASHAARKTTSPPACSTLKRRERRAPFTNEFAKNNFQGTRALGCGS
jgi:hypothetical protein